MRPLLDLPFPWPLLNWPFAVRIPLSEESRRAEEPHHHLTPRGAASSERLWRWLEQRYRVTPGNLPAFFGFQITGQEVVCCEARLWQAAVYYRFVHGEVGRGWWLGEVEAWARAYLPLITPLPLLRFRSALRGLQDLFAAAGLLSLPRGYHRSAARILADLETLNSPPDPQEVARLARYRRTLDRG